MTAPQLERMKFWIVVPKAGTNQIKNPIFSPPDHEQDWTTSGAGVTIEETGDEQRFGAYCMQVNTATGVASAAVYGGLTVTNGDDYTFSFYVKGTSGQTFYATIHDASWVAKGTTDFTATGYWQRVEVTFTSAENSSAYKVGITRNITTSTDPFYVDGAQFEQASAATTLIEGYMPGCRWEGSARNSKSIRSAQHGLGGELLDISDYARILSVHGLGMGDWNQIMTKMTSGGSMYQTHIRKSRNFSMVLAYTGDNQGDMQANRKVIIDALRPDYLFGSEDERRIIRYQGFDSNGDEATNPVDIVCVFQPSHTDTPSLPVFQKDVLNFTIPSGLLNGAYNEGKELDLYADFPAEFIVKRDPQGNWCKWNGSQYESLITGLNGGVNCMAEGPDGKIYVGGKFTNAGGVAEADYLARWNPVTELWEAVVPGIAAGLDAVIDALAFDASGDLYIGGIFLNLGSGNGNHIVKLTNINTYPATIVPLGLGISIMNSMVHSIVVSPDGNVYVGGRFDNAGNVAYTKSIARWDGVAWNALVSGSYAVNDTVRTLALSSNGTLYIGGVFTDAAYPYLCKWNGSTCSEVIHDFTGPVYSIINTDAGTLIIGGSFTNAGGVAAADNIIGWNNNTIPLSTGTNGSVMDIVKKPQFGVPTFYVSGSFNTAGGLTLTDRVAVWSNGAWQPLDIDLPGNAYVSAILPSSDGSLYIGGAFSTTAASENAKTGAVALDFDVASASANTYPVISVNGPGTLKSIRNYSTGKSVMFDGLTLQAGEWIGLNFDPLQLSFRSGWASRGNLMRYVIAGSDYGDFYVSSGANYLSIFMDDTDANSSASITYAPKFWGIDGALL